MELLRTDRLILRRLTFEDAFFVYELMNSPGWLNNIGDRGITSIDKAKEYIETKYFNSYVNGLGNFAVALKETGTLIGTCGLYKREHLEHPDIGFAFLPEYNGKGYAYESALALKEYAQTELKLERLYGFTLPNNTPSKKLLIKLGMMEKGTTTFENDPEVLTLFEINLGNTSKSF